MTFSEKLGTITLHPFPNVDLSGIRKANAEMEADAQTSAKADQERCQEGGYFANVLRAAHQIQFDITAALTQTPGDPTLLGLQKEASALVDECDDPKTTKLWSKKRAETLANVKQRANMALAA